MASVARRREIHRVLGRNAGVGAVGHGPVISRLVGAGPATKPTPVIPKGPTFRAVGSKVKLSGNTSLAVDPSEWDLDQCEGCSIVNVGGFGYVVPDKTGNWAAACEFTYDTGGAGGGDQAVNAYVATYTNPVGKAIFGTVGSSSRCDFQIPGLDYFATFNAPPCLARAGEELGGFLPDLLDVAPLTVTVSYTVTGTLVSSLGAS
jgi:hypothetical protein